VRRTTGTRRSMGSRWRNDMKPFFAVFLLALAATGALASATPPDLTGVWSVVSPVDSLETVDGKLPPLLPAAKVTYEAHLAAAARGDRSFDGTTRCLPPGLPRLMLVHRPFEILQRPNTIYFIHELNRLPRRAYLNETLPTDPDPHYLGYSVARWEGGTLVIESSGFSDDTLLDTAGLPHSDALHLTERYSLDKGGKVLLARFTVEDAKTFTAPWSFTAKFVRRPGYELRENVCADKLAPPQS
jgi:hypothetical protein